MRPGPVMGSRLPRGAARSAVYAVAAVALYLSFLGAAEWDRRDRFQYGTFAMSRETTGFLA